MAYAWRASACGNTFLVLLDWPDANTHLHNLRKTNRWSFDTALVLSESASGGSVHMRVCERDGSESVMCGNGARAVSAILHGLGRRPTIAVRQGLLMPERWRGSHAVPMGQPVFTGLVPLAIGRKLLLAPRYEACGEPHVVVAVPNVDRFPLVAVGRQVVPHANLTVVSRMHARALAARTFERGVNRETESCGTGACSAVWHFVYHGLSRAKEFRVEMGTHHLRVRRTEDVLWLSGNIDVRKERG